MSVNFGEYFEKINNMIDQQDPVDNIIPILEDLEKYYDQGDDGERAEIDRLRYVVGEMLYPDKGDDFDAWVNER